MRSGREGWNLWPIALCGMLVIAALAMIGLDRAVRVQAMAETRAAAANDAAILAAGLESELNKFTLVPRVLAVDPEVAALLADEGRQLAVLNRRLAALAQQTNAAAIYLMDARGQTLASSNWDRPDSFVGSNYGFRSYFAGALRDGMAREFALGTVSRRPGLYLAQRVGPPDRPLGVVAIKVEFDSLERKWRDAEAGVFVTDADGIVLLSSNPQWRFRAAKPAVASESESPRVAARDTGQDALRFGVEQITPLVLPTAGVAGSPVRMVEHIRPIAPTGWELHLLADPAPRLSAAVANGRLAGVTGLALLGLLAAGGVVWQRRRAARAAAEVDRQTAILREQLQQANRLATLGQITAGLGHEIRQPLAAMQVYAESGERLIHANRHAEAAGNFTKIAGLAARIGEITAEQLQFSRRSTGEPKRIALHDVIDGTLLLLRDQIAQKGIALTLPGLETAAITARAQHVQLEQVLVNLLQNAVQACAPVGGRIAVALTSDGHTIAMSVTDNGPGVPLALRDTLFQPFVTGKADGIGLGLAIARDIMQKMGGDLIHSAAEQGAEQGARFTMIMPAE